MERMFRVLIVTALGLLNVVPILAQQQQKNEEKPAPAPAAVTGN